MLHIYERNFIISLSEQQWGNLLAAEIMVLGHEVGGSALPLSVGFPSLPKDRSVCDRHARDAVAWSRRRALQLHFLYPGLLAHFVSWCFHLSYNTFCPYVLDWGIDEELKQHSRRISSPLKPAAGSPLGCVNASCGTAEEPGRGAGGILRWQRGTSCFSASNFRKWVCY